MDDQEFADSKGASDGGYGNGGGYQPGTAETRPDPVRSAMDL